MPYRAPLQDFQFLMDHVADFKAIAATARFEEDLSRVWRWVQGDCRRRMDRHVGQPGIWRHGPANDPHHCSERNDRERVFVVAVEPTDDTRPDRSTRTPRL